MAQNPKRRQAFTPNHIVAYNLRRIRTQRGWTQEQAADALEPYLGVKWSSAQFSVAERWNPKPGQKTRQFDVGDLIALAAGFGVPLGQLLTPPEGSEFQLPGGRLRASAVGDLTGERADRRVIGDLARQVVELGRELGRVQEARKITIHPEGGYTLDEEGSE